MCPALAFFFGTAPVSELGKTRQDKAKHAAHVLGESSDVPLLWRQDVHDWTATCW